MFCFALCFPGVYRIIGIDLMKTPNDTFMRNDTPISFAAYVQEAYKVHMNSNNAKKRGMLIAKRSKRNKNRNQNQNQDDTVNGNVIGAAEEKSGEQKIEVEQKPEDEAEDGK